MNQPNVGAGESGDNWKVVVNKKSKKHIVSRPKPIIGSNKQECSLQVAKKFHWIFLSGLSKNTEAQSISDFLRNKYLGDDSTCEKIMTKSTQIGSFKIGVSMEERDKVMDPSRWPEGGCLNTVMGDLNLCLKECGGTGTMRDNPMPKFCPLSDKKDLQKKERGCFEHSISRTDGILVVKWDDNSMVTTATNRYGISPVTNVRLYSRKEKEHTQVSRPAVLAEYNKKMGVTDRMDQNRWHCTSKNTVDRVENSDNYIVNVNNQNLDKISVLHLNIQSLRSKVSEIEIILNENSIDCLCVNEHWLYGDEFSVLKLSGYCTASDFCRSLKAHGGELHYEVSGILLTNVATQIITVYRAPNGDLGRCLEILSAVLESLDPKLNIIVSGDFNVHFDGKDNKGSELCDLFLSYGMYSTTNFATRGAVCLYNIFTNIENPNNQTEPLRMNHLSDHDGIIYRFHAPSHRKTSKTRISYRPLTYEGFLTLYSMVERVDWSFVNDCSLNVNERFDKFLGVITDAVGSAFPMKSKLIDKTKQLPTIN
nr:unnamed protein product [Callosobruchus analis]